ncbi:MAG TPA: radical SAM protein [Caulobacteraceae bacterium]|nr:radical SAM protein [Caulobacteraceae bacterium]
MSASPAPAKALRRFRVVLIKPSHYDEDGYVIRWVRSMMPSNSLASVYGLVADAAERQVLGADVAFEIEAFDDTNARVDLKAIIADFQRGDVGGFVGLVGVQSNQYPRALDIARPLRAAGVPVVMGGFHVSGVLAMFKAVSPELQQALDLGVSLYAGEAEGRMDEVLCDVAAGSLKPIYDYMSDLPSIEGAVTPFLPGRFVKRVMGNMTSFDAGRGCPFQCSFCTIINVQGRKSRRRTPDDVEAILRSNWDQGITRYFITDDNFARNKDWEIIFDRIIALREEGGMDVRFMIQVDTLCHKIPGFIEKARRAGVTRIFIGLENINPDNLIAAKKRQNKITEYRKMLLAWKAAGIWTYAGYILGFPGDTPASIRADIEIVKRELPLDVLELFFLTPLPGSEDHKTLASKGVPMDPDLNKYDLEHAVTAHPRMTKAEWEEVYWDAWRLYYTPEHIERVLRRARAFGVDIQRLMLIIVWFASSLAVEKVHPLQGGMIRLKTRSERRSGLAIEPVWRFYPRLARDFVFNHARLALEALKIYRIYLRVARDPDGMAYRDQAMAPVDDETTESFELFTHSSSAREAVERARKFEAVVHGHAAAS